MREVDSGILGGLRQLRPDWFQRDNGGRWKMELLGYAKAGESVASIHDTSAWKNLVCRASARRDPAFVRQLKQLRPDWFAREAAINKWLRFRKQLLNLAKGGHCRRHSLSRLGKALCALTGKGSQYDRDFDVQIRQLRPDWFGPPPHRLKIRRLIGLLIRRAKDRMPRPHSDSRLGRLLASLMSTRSSSYDPKLHAALHKLSPNWFRTNTFVIKRDRLILLAKRGARRPHPSTPLGSFLYNQGCKKATDESQKLWRHLLKLRPDWFRPGLRERVLKERAELIALARKGALRPHSSKTSLGRTLSRLTVKGRGYDQEFHRLLHRLRPTWFSRTIQILRAQRERKRLIALAKSGSPKPNFSKKLGWTLNRLTSRSRSNSSKGYDRDFDFLVRRLRPDWF